MKLKIKQFHSEQTKSQENQSAVKPKPGNTGVKLPKISIPLFDGNILNWGNFWEQFEVAIHSREQLMDAEKLVYLKDCLKEGPARHVIGGLSQTSENYKEAITCLQERYNRP